MTRNVSSTDRAIIRLLQQNARASFAELSRQTNIPESTVRRRMERLQELGVIGTEVLGDLGLVDVRHVAGVAAIGRCPSRSRGGGGVGRGGRLGRRGGRRGCRRGRRARGGRGLSGRRRAAARVEERGRRQRGGQVSQALIHVASIPPRSGACRTSRAAATAAFGASPDRRRDNRRDLRPGPRARRRAHGASSCNFDPGDVGITLPPSTLAGSPGASPAHDPLATWNTQQQSSPALGAARAGLVRRWQGRSDSRRWRW